MADGMRRRLVVNRRSFHPSYARDFARGAAGWRVWRSGALSAATMGAGVSVGVPASDRMRSSNRSISRRFGSTVDMTSKLTFLPAFPALSGGMPEQW